MIYKEMFERLPERFRKTNTKKIYEILFTDYDVISNTLKDIGDSRDIDNAYGKTLDLIGSNVGALRTDEDDELFRQLIKIQIIANRSKGDIPTINKVAKVILGEDYLGLEEVWSNDLYHNELAAIVIKLSTKFKRIPYKTLNTVAAGGVRLYFEMFYDEESINIQEQNLLLKTKYKLANRTKTESRRVHSINNNINVNEDYALVPVKYKKSGRTKTNSIESIVDYKDICMSEKQLSTRVKMPLCGRAICGGAR